MDPLTSIGLVIWTLVSLGLTLNVLHPLINRDRARPLSLIFGFGAGMAHWRADDSVDSS